MMTETTRFDIYSFGFDKAEDEGGMLESSRLINQLISAEVELGINSDRIVLGGFSQGATMSLLGGLTSERKLAGIIALSGWLPLHKKFKNMLSQHATSTPIFWGHGSDDPLVKVQLCHSSVENLTKDCGILKAEENKREGLTVNIYEGLAHSTSQEELDHLRSWLKYVIPNEEGRL
ncbi:hypothetical protein AX15_005291 [Amanita polypyramis BW_CC]|nr:hypothetical protein AX15_005291 [Amanita polypyramis BW_CC]